VCKSLVLDIRLSHELQLLYELELSAPTNLNKAVSRSTVLSLCQGLHLANLSPVAEFTIESDWLADQVEQRPHAA
jgi:hypothetical protein